MKCQQCEAPVTKEAPFCEACGAKVVRTSLHDPLIGRTFLDQYTLRKKLGQGGFGSVYEADQPSISRKAAIKVLHPHLAHQMEMAVRFRREGLAASRLSHPSVVKVYNFGETEDEIIWIAMEYIEGETLSARLRRKGPLTSQELQEILFPICDALHEAHQKGIVHRDLKPDNIMLAKGPNGEVTPKLLDFGVAALVDDLQVTQSGALSGSPQYMPPEQWKGLKYTDARSDIYALGVVAYQCLTNRLPFDADTAPAWMQKHCAEPPISMELANPKISKALQATIFKALAKDPNDRFQTALELKRSLEEAARGIAPELPASLALPRPPQAASSKKLYVGVLIGLVAAFGGGFLLQRPQAAPPAAPSASAPASLVASAPTKVQEAPPTTAPTSIALAATPTQKETPPKASQPSGKKTSPQAPAKELSKAPEPREDSSIPGPDAKALDEEYSRKVREQLKHLGAGCNLTSLPIRVDVHFHIDKFGGVFNPSTPASPAVKECVLNAFKGLTVSPPPNGRERSFYIELSLKPR